MRKKKTAIALGIALGYVALILLLVAAERGDPDASIVTVWDALWYSFVTVSTVGYGDLYPVTPLGKIIGGAFVLLSVGALAFLVGAAVSLFTGSLLPKIKLYLHRKEKWYLFSEYNDQTAALARSIRQCRPKSRLLFPMTQKDDFSEEFDSYPGTMQEAAAIPGGKRVLLYMGSDGTDNYLKALDAAGEGRRVLCATEHIRQSFVPGLRRIRYREIAARKYWDDHPLGFREQQILLIGDGASAWQLLERGLMTNLLSADQAVQYHVFGNWEDFLREHPGLSMTVAIGEKASDRDSLAVHSGPWNQDGALLQGADRIILCGDDDSENIARLRHLRQYFPTAAPIHILCSREIPGETVFGSVCQTCTAENILADGLTAAARCMHSIYLAESGGNGQTWEELSEFTRQSNIAAADHLSAKMRLLLGVEGPVERTAENCRRAYEVYAAQLPLRRQEFLKLEHLRWMRFHSLYNWRYGPVRDNEKRIHPMLLPFEELTEREQAKDEYAWRLLLPLAQEIEKLEET